MIANFTERLPVSDALGAVARQGMTKFVGCATGFVSQACMKGSDYLTGAKKEP